MERDPRAFLWDVQQAVIAIQQFIQGMDATSYADSALVRSAVERQFEIIGFRNILIHGYASIDHARVWQIAVDLVPELKQVVSALLDSLGSD